MFPALNGSGNTFAVRAYEEITKLRPAPRNASDSTYETQLRSALADKYAAIFVGHSGKGYIEPDLLRHAMAEDIHKLLTTKCLRPDQLIVVAGGTPNGIGEVYKVAKNMGVATLGLVALQGKDDKATDCDTLITVDNGTPDDWSRKLPESREEIIVSALRIGNSNLCLGGELFAYNGGRQTYDETLAAARQGYPVNIVSHFEPVDDNREQPFKNLAEMERLQRVILEKGWTTMPQDEVF